MMSLEFFIDIHPSGRTVTLGLAQPLTEMSTRNNSRGKGGRSFGLTTLPHLYADCVEIWDPKSPGILRVCPDLYWDCFTLEAERGTALPPGRSRVRYPMVSLECFIDIILPVALWLWGRHSLQHK